METMTFGESSKDIKDDLGECAENVKCYACESECREEKDVEKPDKDFSLISYDKFMMGREVSEEMKVLIKNILTVGWQPDFHVEYPNDVIVLEAVVERWKTLTGKNQGFSTDRPSRYSRVQFTVWYEKKQVTVMYGLNDGFGFTFLWRTIENCFSNSLLWRDILYMESRLGDDSLGLRDHKPVLNHSMYVDLPKDEVF
jgi:hypothetical protein